MKRKYLSLFSTLMGIILLTSCISQEVLKQKIIEINKEDPQFISGLLQEHPRDVMLALQNSAKKLQQMEMQRHDQQIQSELKETFQTPLKPSIGNKDIVDGSLDAPINLVVYTDFECPFCRKSYYTIKKLKSKYGKNIKIIFKNFPLRFHPHAFLSAQYFYSLYHYRPSLAFRFHDLLFERQSELKNRGASFLKSALKILKVDYNKIKKKVDSPETREKIYEDIEEAKSFGIEGTPGFILNGIPIRGAYPIEYFMTIIAELEKRGKIKL